MFTGIVEELGTVAEVVDRGRRHPAHRPGRHRARGHGAGRLHLRQRLLPHRLRARRGAVDRRPDAGDARQDLTARVAPGDRVNLERAVTVDVSVVTSSRATSTASARSSPHPERALGRRRGLPPGIDRYLVDKGSITVDGVSLTVVEAREDSFTVSLIPETLARTTLGARGVGDLVNLEADVIAKHVEKLLGAYTPTRTSAHDPHHLDDEEE